MYIGMSNGIHKLNQGELIIYLLAKYGCNKKVRITLNIEPNVGFLESVLMRFDLSGYIIPSVSWSSTIVMNIYRGRRIGISSLVKDLSQKLKVWWVQEGQMLIRNSILVLVNKVLGFILDIMSVMGYCESLIWKTRLLEEIIVFRLVKVGVELLTKALICCWWQSRFLSHILSLVLLKKQCLSTMTHLIK